MKNITTIQTVKTDNYIVQLNSGSYGTGSRIMVAIRKNSNRVVKIKTIETKEFNKSLFNQFVKLYS